MSRSLIAPALRHALACKGHSVRALGQTLSDFLSGTSKSLTSSSAVAVSMVVATKRTQKETPTFVQNFFSTPVASRHGKKVCERIPAHAFIEFFS